jgi:hypothetical protein
MTAVSAGQCADEFECVDCGRFIISFPTGSRERSGGRCAACAMMPGWFLLPELRRAIEPDAQWAPPRHPARGLACEVPGCAGKPSLRVNGYSEPPRLRCPDHLADWVYRALHQARN